MLKKLGNYLVSRKHRTGEDKVDLGHVVDGVGGQSYSLDERAHQDSATPDVVQQMGLLNDGDYDALLMTNVDLDDDFNLLEDSPDGGRTYYSGGRDAAGQRETVRWEGVGLIRTPRNKTGPTPVWSDSATELCTAPVVEKDAQCVSVTGGSYPKDRALRKQLTAPACYRELRELKSWNRSPTARQHSEWWHIACQNELDRLRQQWIDYQKSSRGGQRRTRRTWWRTQSALESCFPEEGRPFQGFTETAQPEQQVQQNLDNASISRELCKQAEPPVPRCQSQDDASPLTNRSSSGLSTDSRIVSPTPDVFLQEALAVASQFSDSHNLQHRAAHSMNCRRAKIASVEETSRACHEDMGKRPSCASQRHRTSGRLESAVGAKGFHTPLDLRSAPLKTPRGSAAQRDLPHASRPPRSPAATPRSSRNPSNSRTAARIASPAPGKNSIPKLDFNKLRGNSVAERPSNKQNATKGRAFPSPRLKEGIPPRGSFAGADTGTPRTGPALTPRGTPRSGRRSENSGPQNRPRKGPQGRAARSPRPGIGAVPHTPLHKSPRDIPKGKCNTPRGTDNYTSPKTRALPSSNATPHVSANAFARLGPSPASNKVLGALLHGVPSATSVQ